MVNWSSEIATKPGALYQKLAEKIESDIDNGTLTQGDRLPAQRDLAQDVGTTIGTVGRAYSLLRQRGLISGEVGRGTYVLRKKQATKKLFSSPLEKTRQEPSEKTKDKIPFHKTGAPDIGQEKMIIDSFIEETQKNRLELSSCVGDKFSENCLEAGSLWLSRNSFHASPNTVIPVSSVHAGLTATIAALTNPGDTVVFECLTSAEISRSTALIGRRIILAQLDQQGIDPEHFEKLCLQEKPKAIFLSPAAQNPTATALPKERRMEIARIACDHDIIIIEDDSYGHMTKDPQPLMAELVPERTVISGGFSKSVSTKLPIGWISCPPSWYRRIRIAHTLISGNLLFPSMELASQLVLSGKASQIRNECKKEIDHRLQMIKEILKEFSFNTRPGVPFVWLYLPDPWMSATFKIAALENNLLISEEDEFKAGRSEKAFHAIRLSISSPVDTQDIRRGLNLTRRILKENHVGYAGSD